MSLTGYHHVSDILMHVAQDPRPVSVLTHEFIQSVVFASFPQDNDLQIERLNLAVRLYSAIGFTRKAAFYQRFAALKYVSVHLKSPNWKECYNCLLGSLAGYGLTLDPIDYERSLSVRDNSWPGIHLQLLEELITCCRKLQLDALAIRHMSFILHSLDDFLSDSKKRDLAEKLDVLSSRCGEDSPIELRLDNGFIMPQVNLTKFPLCVHFEPLQLAVPLCAYALTLPPDSSTTNANNTSKSPTKATTRTDNPFIFTPFTARNDAMAAASRRAAAVDANGVAHADFRWVQDETATTLVMFRNTLPFELHVSGLRLLANGPVPLETLPTTLKLAPSNTNNEPPVSVHLYGIPRSCSVIDRVDIYGYSTHVLGVKSNCHLESISHTTRSKFPKRHAIQVLPPMARLEIDIKDANPSLETVDSDIQSVNGDRLPQFVDFIKSPVPDDEVKASDHVMLLVHLKRRVDQTGEGVASMSVLLRNTSTVCSIDHIAMQLILTPISGQVIDKDPPPFRIESSSKDIEKCLPLAPGASGSFDLAIVCSAHDTNTVVADSTEPATVCVLMFEYSGGTALELGYCRKAALKVIDQ